MSQYSHSVLLTVPSKFIPRLEPAPNVPVGQAEAHGAAFPPQGRTFPCRAVRSAAKTGAGEADALKQTTGRARFLFGIPFMFKCRLPRHGFHAGNGHLHSGFDV